MHLDKVIDELRYVNYAANRDYAPHVSPERWGRIYANVHEMEARYQAEKAITKAKAERSCPKCGGVTVVARYGPECSAGCDTSVEHCLDCGWQGDPE